MMWGITNFDYVDGGHFVFSSSGSVFKCFDQLPLGSGNRGVFPEELRTSAKTPRLDPQMCPADPDIIAYVTNGDIWVRNRSRFEVAELHTHAGFNEQAFRLVGKTIRNLDHGSILCE